MNWPAILTVAYLAGVITLAIALPKAVLDQDQAKRIADNNPIGVALYLALIVIAWPATVPYALISKDKT